MKESRPNAFFRIRPSSRSPVDLAALLGLRARLHWQARSRVESPSRRGAPREGRKGVAARRERGGARAALSPLPSPLPRVAPWLPARFSAGTQAHPPASAAFSPSSSSAGHSVKTADEKN